ncbi:hypothetical protein GCM10010919_31950 [Alishewanella longhuensis]|uniref:PBP domain-containing protein n=1 Tax=Alishewanella longhuensis TaxID=1091037 RepID=A0ABQ3L1Y5_9ALTE|nr:hypothetical protein [Alishewanella longhuensis]GHG76807.1 hypothetical protein GCM10010919_31950 [Alishewanella longhuensis]
MTLLRALYCLLLLLSWPVKALEVVAHSSVSEEQLSTSQLRAIFTMRQTRWSDGQPIQVFVLNSADEQHIRFSRNYLKMFPYQLDAIWDRQRFSGIGSFPTQVQSEEEMLLLLKQTPGAIGYLATDKGSPAVRVVVVHEK